MMEENGLPKGWVETTLGENLSEIAMGPFGSNLKVDMFTKSGVPIIKGSNLLKDFVSGDFTFVSEEKANSLGKAIAFPNDLIITHRGTLGQVSLVPKNKYKRYVTSQSQLRLSVNPKKIYYRYLLYFFKSRTGQYELLKNASQVGVPAISTPTKSIKEVELIIPSNIQEQNAIASILTSFDDKIELLQAQNETLETIAQTIFKEWFGKYQVGDELPEGWRVGELRDLVECIIDNRGKTPPLTEYSIDAYPLVEVNSLTGSDRGIDLCLVKKYVDKQTYKNWFRKGHPISGDILLSTVGSIGQLSLVFNENVCIAQNIIAIRSNVSGYFLYELLKINQSLIISLDISSVQPSIKVPHLLNMNVIIPQLELIQQFHDVSDKLTKKIMYNNTQIQTLQATRDTLLPKLMSGQLRVAEFQEQLSEVM